MRGWAGLHRARPIAGGVFGQLTRGTNTKRRLIEAAAAEFALRGPDARVGDMAARLGLTQPAFYRHFDCKEAVHTAVVEDFRGKLRDLVANSLIPPGTVESDVRILTAIALATLMDFLDGNRDAMTVAMLREPEGEATRQELIRLIASNVGKEMAEGFFRENVSPEFFATCLVGIVTQFARTPSDPAARRGHATKIAGLLFDGIRRRD